MPRRMAVMSSVRGVILLLFLDQRVPWGHSWRPGRGVLLDAGTFSLDVFDGPFSYNMSDGAILATTKQWAPTMRRNVPEHALGRRYQQSVLGEIGCNREEAEEGEARTKCHRFDQHLQWCE